MSHHHATPARRCCTPAARRRHPRRFAVAPRRLRLDCATTHPQRVAGNSNAFLVPRIGFSSPPPAAPLKRRFTTTATPSTPGCEDWRSAVRRRTWRKSRSECAGFLPELLHLVCSRLPLANAPAPSTCTVARARSNCTRLTQRPSCSAPPAPSAATTPSSDRPHRIRPAGTALHTHPAPASQLHQGEPLLPLLRRGVRQANRCGLQSRRKNRYKSASTIHNRCHCSHDQRGSTRIKMRLPC